MFWEIMGPKAGGAPKGELAKAIDASFTSFDNFKVEFEKAGTRTANGIEWTLYKTQAEVSGLDLALGQGNNITYMVMMQSPLNDRKALVEGVFLPAVDALKPQ